MAQKIDRYGMIELQAIYEQVHKIQQQKKGLDPQTAFTEGLVYRFKFHAEHLRLDTLHTGDIYLRLRALKNIAHDVGSETYKNKLTEEEQKLLFAMP